MSQFGGLTLFMLGVKDWKVIHIKWLNPIDGPYFVVHGIKELTSWMPQTDRNYLDLREEWLMLFIGLKSMKDD